MEIVYQVFDSFWFQAIIKLILGFVLAGIIGLSNSKPLNVTFVSIVFITTT